MATNFSKAINSFGRSVKGTWGNEHLRKDVIKNTVFAAGLGGTLGGIQGALDEDRSVVGGILGGAAKGGAVGAVGSFASSHFTGQGLRVSAFENVKDSMAKGLTRRQALSAARTEARDFINKSNVSPGFLNFVDNGFKF